MTSSGYWNLLIHSERRSKTIKKKAERSNLIWFEMRETVVTNRVSKNQKEKGLSQMRNRHIEFIRAVSSMDGSNTHRKHQEWNGNGIGGEGERRESNTLEKERSG